MRDQMVGPWQAFADATVTAASFIDYYEEAMAMGERPSLTFINPSATARITVGEAITNIACADIGRLSKIKLSANWIVASGDNDDDFTLYQMVKTDLIIPVGNDSLSMKTTWVEDGSEKSVTSPASLIISAIAPVQDIRKTLTPELCLQTAETVMIFIDLSFGKNHLGGSCFAQENNQLGENAPDIEAPVFKGFFNAIQTLIQQNKILACHDRSDGGLFAALCEMMFAARCGLYINIDDLGNDTHGVLLVKNSAQ